MNILGSASNAPIVLLNDDFYEFGFPEQVIKEIEKLSKPNFVSNHLILKDGAVTLDLSTAGTSIKHTSRAEINIAEYIPRVLEEDVEMEVVGLKDSVKLVIPKGTKIIRITIMFINKDLSLTITDVANNVTLGSARGKITVVRGTDLSVISIASATLVFSAFLKENIKVTRLADHAISVIKKFMRKPGKTLFKSEVMRDRFTEVERKLKELNYVEGKSDMYKESRLIAIREIYEEYYSLVLDSIEEANSSKTPQEQKYPIYKRPRGSKKLRSA